MRVFFIGVFLSVLFWQCAGNTEGEKDLIDQGTVKTGTVSDTCFCDDLLPDSSGVLFRDDAPFTGVCIHNYPATDQKYMVKNVLEGKLHGSVIYYDQQGGLLFEEVYENGEQKRSGESAPLSCDCSELEKTPVPGETQEISTLDGIPYTGKCLKSYPNSDQLYMEISYDNGVLHGFSIFYDMEGNTMYMEKYEYGELLKVIYEED